jgi:riboflavin kinase/FMN adenylyltransferase
VAVGEFDGVHIGHREVIASSDTVLTFDPHPLQVVRPEAAPRLLTSLAVKAELIAELGVEELVVIPFDRRFAHQTPQEFIEQVLVQRLGAEVVSVGENFRFGYRAAGDPALLAGDPRFRTRVVPLVEVEGEVVSSSHIRALVLAGEVELAAKFLGAPFQIEGKVVPDRQHRSRRVARLPWTRRICRLCRWRAGGCQRGRPSHVRHRPRGADRGLHHRPASRSLRSHIAGEVHQAPAGRAPV